MEAVDNRPGEDTVQQGNCLVPLVVVAGKEMGWPPVEVRKVVAGNLVVYQSTQVAVGSRWEEEEHIHPEHVVVVGIHRVLEDNQQEDNQQAVEVVHKNHVTRLELQVC